MEKFTEIKTFRVRKMTFLIRLWFLGYSCKSGIAIFLNEPSFKYTVFGPV